MSESSIVTILVALIGSGIWGALRDLRRPGRNRRAHRAPITATEVDAVHAHTSQQETLTLVFQLSAQLKQITSNHEALDREVQQLRADRDRDAEQIRSIRSAYKALSTWAHDLVTNWAEHRLKDNPPDLPPTNLM